MRELRIIYILAFWNQSNWDNSSKLILFTMKQLESERRYLYVPHTINFIKASLDTIKQHPQNLRAFIFNIEKLWSLFFFLIENNFSLIHHSQCCTEIGLSDLSSLFTLKVLGIGCDNVTIRSPESQYDCHSLSNDI